MGRVTRAEREQAAILNFSCPRQNCRAPAGQPCRYLRGIFTTWVTREFKHPHAERFALLKESTS